jgi:hypothetical protein
MSISLFSRKPFAAFALLCATVAIATPQAATSQLVVGFQEMQITVEGDAPALDPCETGPIGSLCSDGAIYAGDLPNGERFFIASADEPELLQFATESFLPGFSISISDQENDGLANRAYLQIDNPDRVFPASDACASRGPQWYLPSFYEMASVFQNASSIGSSGVLVDGTAYWTSSIRTAGMVGPGAMARSSTNILGSLTNTPRAVRCARSGQTPVIPAASVFNLTDVFPGEIFELPIYSVYTRGIADLSVSGTLPLTVSGIGASNVATQPGFHLSPRLVLRATAPTNGSGPFTSEVRFDDQVVATVTANLYQGEDCTTGPVGSRCADGSFYAGLTDGQRFYVAPSVEGTFRFSTSGTVPASEISSTSDGLRNTLVLLAREQSEIYEAAQACRAKGSEWYVPSTGELGTIFSGLNNFPAWFLENERDTLVWSSRANSNTMMWGRRASAPTSITGMSLLSSFPVLCVRTDLNALGVVQAIIFPDQLVLSDTVVTSDNRIVLAGRSTSAVPFSISGDGDPLVSVMGGSFISSGFVSPGESVRIRMSSSETKGVTRIATLTIGGVDSTFNVTSSPDCLTGPVGSLCESGDFYAGLTVNNARMYVAPADEIGTFQWKTEGTFSPGSTSLSDGFQNTAALLAGAGTHPAAAACRARGPEWYLPARDEQTTLYNNRVALAGAAFTAASVWSSSEAAATTAHRRVLTTTTVAATTKTTSSAVRCVRTDEGVDPGTPNVLAFTGGESRVARNTVVTSAPVILSGFRSIVPVPISVNGDGDPVISINGGPFVESGLISVGETVTVRMTASDEFDQARTATVTVQGVSSPFTVTTIVDCLVGPIGTRCEDGAVYAGLNAENVRIYVAEANEPLTWAWKNATTSTPGATSATNGRSNTDAIIAAGIESHPAAAQCVARGEDWFLPSMEELAILYTNRASLGSAAFPITGTTAFWSSGEATASNANRRRLESTTIGATTKTGLLRVRCVRY